MKALQFLSLVIALAACDATRDDVAFTLAADAPAYAVGGDVALTLRNDGPVTAETGVLYCALLEVRTASGWARSPEGNARVCPRVLVPVGPGEALTARVPLDGVGPGTYRFAHEVTAGGSALRPTTAPFEVR